MISQTGSCDQSAGSRDPQFRPGTGPGGGNHRSPSVCQYVHALFLERCVRGLEDCASRGVQCFDELVF